MEISGGSSLVHLKVTLHAAGQGRTECAITATTKHKVNTREQSLNSSGVSTWS